MLGAVERRFGNDLPSSPVEWLTDNGSCYRANETRQFARMLERTLQRRSSIITNGIRIVRWVIARHGNICGSGLVMG